jgi:hypothetical protein
MAGLMKTPEDSVTRDLNRERAQTEILAAVDAAEAALGRGEGRVITQDSMRNLAAEVKQRGRANFAACDELMRRKRCEAPQPDDRIR